MEGGKTERMMEPWPGREEEDAKGEMFMAFCSMYLSRIQGRSLKPR